MIDESTKEKLRKLKVDEMIDSLEGLDNTLRNEEISFDEKFKYLIACDRNAYIIRNRFYGSYIRKLPADRQASGSMVALRCVII